MLNERVRKPSVPLYGLPGPRDEPGKPPAESRKGPPPAPKGDPSKPRMTEVTVKLPETLLAKLDRMVKRHSAGLAKAGRSTVLRWLLDQHPE